MFLNAKNLFVLLLLCASLLTVRAQEVTVNYDSEKLSVVLADISQKTGYNFVYNNSFVNVDTLVTASASGDVKTVLDAVLGKLSIEFDIVDRQIILRPKSEGTSDEVVEVRGVVLDEFGQPLPGVAVAEKGTQNITSTDMEGQFVTKAHSKAQLVFTFMGFAEAERSVPKAGGTLTVNMQPEAQNLDDAVIVGYAVQKKSNLTGSVSQINFSDNLESRPITSVSSSLAGLVPGLVATQSSGRPGEDGATIRIRGNTTLNTNDPLVLVDGIEYSMDKINPQDIETMTVLKDASTTAIYGSRAANGVILITTKSGKSGKVHISYSGQFTLEMPSLGGMSYVDDYAESMRLVNEGADNLGVSHAYSDQTIALWENAKQHPNDLNAYNQPNYMAYPNTNWFDELFGNGFMQSHNVSVSGGNDKVRSYVSLGYMDNPGVMSRNGCDSGTKKVDIRANVDFNIAKWLTGGVKVFGERQEYGMSNVSSGFGYLKTAIPGMYPGTTNKWGSIATDEENPNANNIFKNMASVEGQEYSYRGYASAYLKARLYEGLTLEVTGNHNFNINYVNKYDVSANLWNYTTNSMYDESSLATAGNSISQTNTFRTNGEILLRYNGTFGKNEVGAIAGYSVNYYKSLYSYVSKQGKTDWSVTEMSAYANLLDSDSSTSEWGLMSGFGRVTYAYDSKYLAEVNFRADGSSRFAPESRWGFFPSFSAGWCISKENWMKSSRDWLSNLKIRASWGVTGNNNSGNYAWQSTYSNVNVVSGGTDSKGLVVTALGNNGLIWETTRTGDVGVDFGFFKNRLTGEIDGYVKNTDGILYRPAIYMTMGAVTAPYENLAGVQNKGVEFTLNWRDKVGSDFNYSVGFNFAYNRSVVTAYKGKLEQCWVEDSEGNKTYKNNLGDVASGGFGGYIVEDHILGDQYILTRYQGSGAGYSGEGTVDPTAGPKDGMIRTEADYEWVKAMIREGYTFQGGSRVGKNILYYGDFIYADVNGDGDYGNSDDYSFTGHNNVPKITTGLNLSFSWKGFDLYMLFTGAFDFYLNWNTSVYNTTLVNKAQAIMTRIADDHYYYDPDGDPALNNIDATYPRLTYNKTMNADLSDFYHYRGDYVKLKNITFGYTFKRDWMEKIYVSNLRLYVSAENILTITDYPGLDPEIGTSITYPLMKSVCGGIQLTF